MVAEVQQVATQRVDVDSVVGLPPFVKHASLMRRGPHARVFGPQADLPIRIPPSMANPCSAIVGQSRHGPCPLLRRWRRGLPLHQFFEELVAQRFVRIQTEYEWLQGLACSPVLLIRIGCESPIKHPCTMGFSNGFCRICRTRINDHDILCHPCHRCKASRQVERFIFGNDNNAEHGLQVRSCSPVPTGESAAQLWIKRLVAPCGLTYF